MHENLYLCSLALCLCLSLSFRWSEFLSIPMNLESSPTHPIKKY